MAKGDYTNSERRTRYRSLVATNTDSRITVDANEKRERAELLDMVEDLFQDGNRTITADKLRAFLHILVKSVQNSSDDTVDITNVTNGRSLPTQAGANRGELYVDNGFVKVR
tara:strand:+ start:1024 stop:1359 length:336 start_codon:yes stop_codon:yes gene_type:complete